MESPDQNPFPEIHILPVWARVRRFAAHVLRFMPDNAPDYMSDHFDRPIASSDVSKQGGDHE